MRVGDFRRDRVVQANIKSWRFNGEFFESCNCEVNCPCHFGSPATYDTCDMVLAWHINAGRYGDTPLDELNFAMVARAPKHMAEGNWTVAIYIDERAAEPQQEALRLIVSGEAGGGGFARRKDFTGTILGVKAVPIAYEVTGRRRRLTILNALNVELEAMPGARQGEFVNLVNDPGAGARGYTPRTIAKAVTHKFSDYSLSWDNTGKSCYFAQVEMSGP